MKFRLLLVGLLLGAMLTSMGHIGVDAQSSYAIQWGGQSWKGGHAIKRDGKWYVPASVLKDAYGISVRLNNNKTLELTETKGNSELQYKPMYYQDKVITLMYHNIQSNPKEPSFISPRQLEEQITAMKEAGFNFISMNDYVKFAVEGKSVPDNSVLVTFDDGYETFYKEAYPLLKRLHVPATNFIIVETIDKKFGHPKLTWAQMREMKANGYSFFSHTFNSHHYMPINKTGKTKPMLSNRVYNKKTGRIESNQEYLVRVKKDLSSAEKRLKEMIGNEYGVIAFPYGAYNKDVLQIAKDLNVKVTFTVRPGINDRYTFNGYRVNGGNQKINTALLVEQMRNDGIKLKSAPKYLVKWNGVGISFKSAPIISNGHWYVSLRDMKDQFGLSFKVDDRNETVQLYGNPDSSKYDKFQIN